VGFGDETSSIAIETISIISKETTGHESFPQAN